MYSKCVDNFSVMDNAHEKDAVLNIASHCNVRISHKDCV